MIENRHFKACYLVSPVQDFSSLIKYCDQIRFVSSGESIEQLEGIIRESLEDFNPATDAIIPAGKSPAVLMCGMILAEKFPGRSIWIGIYQSTKSHTEKRYLWFLKR